MARHIGDILKKRVLRQLKRASKRLEGLRQAWDEVVPEEFRGHSGVLSVRLRTLTVWVDSSAALSELATYHREALLEALNERLGEEGQAPVRDIRFVLEEHH